MNAKIKWHGWHDVKIDDTGLMTGDTYKVTDFIKKYLGGRWDATRKGWVIDMELVKSRITETGTLTVR